MIIIPERELVVILTPRTGTRSLKRAIAQRYPQSMMLYRHMEADGVPQGYDRWLKVGVVRDPVSRLHSLWKYLQNFGLTFLQYHDETYTTRMRASVAVPFEDWLLYNELPFTSPYDSAGLGRFFPGYAVRHPLPENRKSQFVYLRPDLGTRIFQFSQLNELHAFLDVYPARENGTEQIPMQELSDEGRAYVERWFAWDISATS